MKTIYILINPPFWQSNLAYVLYFLALVILVVLAVFYFRIRLNQKQYRERLDFFINIAHDLHTPLTLIRTPISGLLSRKTMGHDDQESLKLVERNVERLTGFVNQLLDFQKAELKKMKLRVSEKNLGKLLPELLQSFEPLLKTKEIRFTQDIANAEVKVWIDVEKFEKIIYKLISNAVKYSNFGGSIQVTLEYTSKYCQIKFIDNGIGIPKQQQKYIFNHCYRADNSVNLQEIGSGVGLMLTKHLVELHKGKISFESIKGKGTTFNVQFLLKPDFTPKDILNLTPKESDLGLILEDTSETTKKKILLVEDNEELMGYLTRELTSAYDIYNGSNGLEGLQIANQHQVDLIISDIMMPEMNGYEFCAAIKKEIATCHIPVILLTAMDGMEYKIESIALGADDYVEKPFDLDYLKARIENLLASRILLRNKFLTVFDFPKAPDGYMNSLDDTFLSKAIKIVNENIDNPDFSVDKLCKDIAVSRPVLFRKLKALTSQSPQDFIKIIRLKKAAELLIAKIHPVNEVASLCGFADQKYFSTSFKKYFGKSPTSYTKDQSPS